MNKKLTAALAAGALALSLGTTALAATPADQAAKSLNSLGLFQGVGQNSDGSPNFDLKTAPTRAQSITMLIRLLGKEEEAVNGSWQMPFTDVPEWAKPYVGYAYANKLTTGLNDTTFGSGNAVTPSEYLTFVLRALGYESGSDFEWNSAWTLSDKLGVTSGEYTAGTTGFTRGNLASISYDALSAKQKANGKPLYESLMDAKVFTEEAAQQVGLDLKDTPNADAKISLNRSSASVQVGSSVTLTATATPSGTVTWTSSNNSVATVSNGVVRGVSKGSATITATANGKSATCSVTVTEKTQTVEVSRVSLSPSSGTLKVGETATLSASVSPSNATDKFLDWSSSNTSVATVSSSGQVTAVGEGTARITATASNGRSASATIRVQKAADSGSSSSSGNFVVPVVGKEYGPFTATAHYSTGRYWYTSQISSFVVTKCELSSIGKYKLSMSVQGITDDNSPGITLRFFDANNRVLEDVRLLSRVSPNQEFNILEENFAEKETIENAVRMEFFASSDGSKVTSGISGNIGGGNSGSGNNNNTPPDTGNNNNNSGSTTPDNGNSDAALKEARAKNQRILQYGQDIAKAELEGGKHWKNALNSFTPDEGSKAIAADNYDVIQALSYWNKAMSDAQELMGEIKDDPLYAKAVPYLQKYLDCPTPEPKSGQTILDYGADVSLSLNRANYFQSFTNVLISVSQSLR
ncbi:MAG: hypothetical protein HFE80_01155 [Clostridiaceae bacterium]|jgi:uncharacterized protein YjdB|nr:hypothetical protein [Clostridiaceae bacterium]